MEEMTCKEMAEFAEKYCKELEYKIEFKQNGVKIHSEEVDYDEFYNVLRRYGCMSDTLELITDRILNPPVKSPRVKQCAFCGKEFNPRGTNRKYCSAECTYKEYKKRRQTRMNWLIENRANKTCPVCGKEFKAHNLNQKYCSPECKHQVDIKRDRVLYYTRRGREVPERQSGPITCAFCGKEFEPTTYNNRFCSEQCKHLGHLRWERARYAAKRGPLKTKICAFCGKEFLSRNSKKKYCSIKCQIACNSKSVSRMEFPTEKKCKMCGKPFLVTSHLQNHQKYCDECKPVAIREANRKLKKAKRDKLRAAKLAEAVAEEPKKQNDLLAQDSYHEDAATVSKINPSLTVTKATSPHCIFKKHKRKDDTNLKNMIKEAAECGLSYGKYVALLNSGKTYEELKKEYEESKTASTEQSFFARFIQN